MLIMTMIPIAAGVNVNENPQPSKFGLVTIQGFIFRVKEIKGGLQIGFRCLFVHYKTTSILGERVRGFRFAGQTMVIPGNFKGILMPHIIMGLAFGIFEV